MATPRTPVTCVRGVRFVKFVQQVVVAFVALSCAGFAVKAPYGGHAVGPRDEQGLAVSPTVQRQLYRMMRRAVRDQREPDACVSGYRLWTRSTDSARMVDVTALTLAEDDSADTFHIWSHRGLICPPGVPSIHGHVWRGAVVSWPSHTDSATLIRSGAPFNLLAFRLNDDSTFGLRVYWRPQ